MAAWGEPDSFVAALSDEDGASLVDGGRRRIYKKGDSLFGEGDLSDRVFVIRSGRAKISSFTDDGKEVLLALRGAGHLLGEMSALDGEPRMASAQAIDEVEAVILTVDDFTRWLKEHPEAALTLLRHMSARLRESDGKLIEFSAHDSVGRVAKRLVELSEKYGEATDDGVRIDLGLSQEEIAGWTGSSREAVSKALQTLRGRGWIETHRRGITVRDLDALKKRAT
jgi:CRP/FNR family transcriptional regulator, cyclic AMP receptor protein